MDHLIIIQDNQITCYRYQQLQYVVRYKIHPPRGFEVNIRYR